MAMTLHVPLRAIAWRFDGVLDIAPRGRVAEGPIANAHLRRIVDLASDRGIAQVALGDPAAVDRVEGGLGDTGISRGFALGTDGAEDARTVCAALEIDPGGLLFVDHDSGRIAAAAGAGARTFRFTA